MDEGQQIESTQAPIEGQASVSTGDPVEAEISLGEEKVPISKVKEWRSGHMMQSDYTKKTQELANQRKELEPYLQAHQWSQQNPDKWQQVQSIMQGGQSNQYIDPEVQKVAFENQQLRGQMTEIKLKQMLSEVKNDSKYNGFFNDPEAETLLLEKMLARPDINNNPHAHKEAAEKLFEYTNKQRARAILEGEEKIKKEIQGRPAAGKGTMSPPPKFDPSKASKRELRETALSMLG